MKGSTENDTALSFFHSRNSTISKATNRTPIKLLPQAFPEKPDTSATRVAKQATTPLRDHRQLRLPPSYDEAAHMPDTSTAIRTIQRDIQIESLPRSVHINSVKETRTLTKLKNDFRRQNFDNYAFNSFMTGKVGHEYFLGINKERDYGEDAQGREWQRAGRVHDHATSRVRDGL